ncbi:MAG: hypothetical protein ACTSPB_21370, partial [Candidatus Thorarchaeota archaeon]
DKKIVCFGYATHDSEYTMITNESNNILVLLYGADFVSKSMMEQALKVTIDMIGLWLDCEVSEPMFFRSQS